MEENKKRKQTLESAQYGLEIIFNSAHSVFSRRNYPYYKQTLSEICTFKTLGLNP